MTLVLYADFMFLKLYTRASSSPQPQSEVDVLLTVEKQFWLLVHNYGFNLIMSLQATELPITTDSCSKGGDQKFGRTEETGFWGCLSLEQI